MLHIIHLAGRTHLAFCFLRARISAGYQTLASFLQLGSDFMRRSGQVLPAYVGTKSLRELVRPVAAPWTGTDGTRESAGLAALP